MSSDTVLFSEHKRLTRMLFCIRHYKTIIGSSCTVLFKKKATRTLFNLFFLFFVPLRMLAVVFCLRLSCFVCVSVACADQQRTGGGSSEVPPALRAGCKRHHCMIPADISHVTVFNRSLQILSPPCSSFQENGARKLNMTSKSHLHLHEQRNRK